MPSNKRNKRVFRSLQSIAPLLSLLLILMYPLCIGSDSEFQAIHVHRHSEIKSSIASLPVRLGNWHLYETVPLPVGSMRMLNPNAHISRSYQRLGSGNSVKANFVLIHCSSARDMSRHHPARCYPEDGWTIISDYTQDFSMVHSAGIPIQYRIQFFERLDNSGAKRSITVVNTFLLPGDGGQSGVENLENLVSNKELSANGVAQIQINIPGDYRSDERITMARQIVEEMISEIPTDLINLLNTISIDSLVKDAAHG